jgi:SAM-dependent methyltransferase
VNDPREQPSAWVARFAALIPADATVLDVASGGGRHARFFRALGNDVVAVDRDVARLADLSYDAHVEVVEADLEDGRPWPFSDREFCGVIVTNYLYRPILGNIVAAVAVGGVLLYETFAAGNERFGRPCRPEFLLQPGELLEAVRGRLRVVAYEDLLVGKPPHAAMQRIAAVRERG